MTPNPILKVLSTLKKHRVKSLLIGGQACIIYGAAEFSRDSDFIILCTESNLRRLEKALDSLKAKRIYVPGLEAYFLERGHACHFKCGADDVKGLRIDIISKLRGCPPFAKLWERRKIIKLKNIGAINIISLRDLAQSKKTQRDKDWFMRKRLIDDDILSNKYTYSGDRIKWWLMECADPQILKELTSKYPEIARVVVRSRLLVRFAINGDIRKLRAGLRKEEALERRKDIEYWRPLRKELEMLRHKKA